MARNQGIYIVEVFLASLLKACEGGGMAIVAPSLALANSQSASIACHLYAVLMGRRIEEMLILKVESLQRKIFKECCFVL